MHSALSSLLRSWIPVFRYHTYDIIPSCKKDPSTSLGMTLQKRRFPNISFIRDVGYPPPYRHFKQNREIFLALRFFLLPSQMDSPSLLSHIWRYTGVPERSLHFGRDDVTEVTFSQHIRCTLREINPFPHTVISSAARNLPCTLLFLAPFAEGFPFPLSHIRRYTGVPERSLGFARDDDTGIALSKHIRCTLRETNPFPHTVISSAVEKSSLHSALSCSFHGRIPIFRYHTYDIIPSCKKDPSTSLGMTLREYRSLTLPIYFPCNNDTREAPSTFAALLFFMRRTTPLNPTT